MTRPKHAAVSHANRRGCIDILPSGSLRVRVYAGLAPDTKRPRYLSETVQSGPDAEREAEQTRLRLISVVEQQRGLRLNATLDELIQRHIALMSGATTTKNNYKGYHRKHISPLIGHHAIGAITPETINEFYSELARCREHCTADPTTARAHVGHECRPLSAASIRKIHFLLTAAYRSAIRWHWTTHNPATMANPPRKPRPRPQPPTPTEVTRVLTHAWNQPDPMLGIATWTAIATGARRGELCALRWTNFDADRRVLHIRASVAHDGYGLIIKDTKLHQDREIALDRDTTALLVAYRDHCRQQATAHETTLAPDSFIFSLAPDGSACLAPASLGQRFHRLVVRLGIQTTLHKLRHYNATELILANINLRTVAGRLGHLDCSTTLTTYTAWINEADQRTTTQLIERLPFVWQLPRTVAVPSRRHHPAAFTNSLPKSCGLRSSIGPTNLDSVCRPSTIWPLITGPPPAPSTARSPNSPNGIWSVPHQDTPPQCTPTRRRAFPSRPPPSPHSHPSIHPDILSVAQFVGASHDEACDSRTSPELSELDTRLSCAPPDRNRTRYIPARRQDALTRNDLTHYPSEERFDALARLAR